MGELNQKAQPIEGTLDEARKQYAENASDINNLKEAIEGMKDADRAGGRQLLYFGVVVVKPVAAIRDYRFV